MTELHNPITGLPQFSEVQALSYIRHLSETIGYRILGTPELDEAIDYTLKLANDLQQQVDPFTHVQIEVSHQKGDGDHLFEFMGKVGIAAFLETYSITDASASHRKSGRNT